MKKEYITKIKKALKMIAHLKGFIYKASNFL